MARRWDTSSRWYYFALLLSIKGKDLEQTVENWNYRGITLLSVPGKVCAHVLLNRIKAHLHHLRRTEQSGFTHLTTRSTIDRIATLNMILQTRGEYRKPSWVAYVDFRSAFDSVWQTVLWLLLRSKGIPEKILHSSF